MQRLHRLTSQPSRNPFALASALVAFVAVLGLGACKGGKDSPPSQVAARVNGDEITIRQVNEVVTRIPGVNNSNLQAARRSAVNTLIEQQLGIEQALAKKLDTTPEVVGAIENARREILFRAYLASVAASLDKPDDKEIKSYYDEHPQLFSERKVYQLEMIDVASAGAEGKVREVVASAKTMVDAANALKQQGIPFSAEAGVRTAEQIPIVILPVVAQIKDGQVSVIRNGDHVVVVRVIASKSEPVDEVKAAPLIRQFLTNQRGTAAAGKALAELKKSGKIELVGEFASDAPAAAAEAPAAVQPAVAAPNAAPAAVATPVPVAPGGKNGAVAVPDAQSVDRGVSGLK